MMLTRVLTLLTALVAVKANVVGIDLGTELIKTSVIRPGKKLQVIETPSSNRMLPNAVGFIGDLRVLGEQALAASVKNPDAVLLFGQRAVGLSENSTAIQRYYDEYLPFHCEKGVVELGTVGISPETATAMMIDHIDSIAQESSILLKDAVVTVPAFFTLKQRGKLVESVEAARFGLLSLIQENTAAALYYGIERFDNSTAHYVLLYNLGASYLQVSVVKYSTALKKSSRLNLKWLESIEVLAHAFDSELGGATFDVKLAEFLAEKSGVNPKTDSRAMRKLINAANSAKKTLSASKQATVNIHSLAQGKDFRYELEREVLDGIIEQYRMRLTAPIETALEKAGIRREMVDNVEVIGGVSRIPKIHSILSETIGQPQTHLNGDEAMAYGASVFASNYTANVQLKPAWLIDKLVYPIKVVFKSNDREFHKEKEIFPELSPLGMTKKLAFHSDFDINCLVYAKYTDEYELIDQYFVTGTKSIARKYKIPSVQTRFEFEVTTSGLFRVARAEAVAEVEYEKEITVKDSNGKDTNEKELILKKKTIREDLSIVPVMHVKDNAVTEMRELIKDYNEQDIEKKRVLEHSNDLESYIYYVLDKQEGAEFQKVQSPEDLQTLNSTLNATLEELKGFSVQTSKKIRKTKEELENLVSPILQREEQLLSRENSILNAFIRLAELYEEMSYLNMTKTWISAEEKHKVFLLLNETISWLDRKEQEQGLLKDWEPPAVKSSTIENKVKGAEKRIEIIKNTPRPKPGKGDL